MKDRYKANEQFVEELVEVHPGVLVLQLDVKQVSQSMQQLTERLRERIEQANPSVAVVDTTGVANIDAVTTRHLADIISALRLVGTQVLLTRRDHSFDRKLTHLGVDLSDITMCHSLAAGLRMALDIVERVL